MSTTNRRAFLKSSALLAAPLAVVAVPAGAALADDGSAARLARIEDERAIEALHRAFLREAGATTLKKRKGQTIKRIEPDHEADPAPVEFADDGKRATVRYRCALELASEHRGHTTIEQMARLQGNAADVRRKRCVIVAQYHKRGGAWALQSAEFA
jgi:hypothetical protein